MAESDRRRGAQGETHLLGGCHRFPELCGSDMDFGLCQQQFSFWGENGMDLAQESPASGVSWAIQKLKAKSTFSVIPTL